MEGSSTKTTYIRAGFYSLNTGTACLNLTSADSGISLLAYPGETPVLSGGFYVPNWQSEPSIPGAYSAPFPAAYTPLKTSETNMPPVVTFNGMWCDVARTPNVSSSNRWNDPASFFFASGSTDSNHFTYRNTDLNSGNYNSEPGAGIGMWSNNGWYFDPLIISSMDFNTKTVSMSTGTRGTIASNSRYFIYGTKGSLDAPGEFWADNINNRLWLIPNNGVSPNNATVIISPAEGPAIIDINGANNVLISGFVFHDQCHSGRWSNSQGGFELPTGAVRVRQGNSDTIQNCSMSCLGSGVNFYAPAAGFGNGATDCTVRNCEIFDTVCGGIGLGGANSVTYPNNQALANSVHDIGLFEATQNGIWSDASPNNVAYNQITNVPHFGIVSGIPGTASNGLTIQYNSLQQTSQGDDDTGAIYLKNGGAYNSSAPDVVRYNSIDDTGGAAFDSNGAKSYPGWSFGIYLDWDSQGGQSGTQVYGNLINNSGNGGVFCHEGQNNNVYDNIIANANQYEMVQQAATDPWTNSIHNNIFYHGADYVPLALDSIWTTQLVTEQYSFLNNDYWNYNYSGYNSPTSVFVDIHGPTGTLLNASNGYPQFPYSWNDWLGVFCNGASGATEDTGSIQADPLFVSPSTGNFALQSNSPALSSPISFTPLPFASMGQQGYVKTPPTTPTGVSASAGNGQVTLSWNAVSGAVSYDIYRSTTAGGEGTVPVNAGITTTSYTDTGLTNGTQYYYMVAAENRDGVSGKSAEVSATPTTSTNLALNKSVVASSTYSSSYAASYAVDGDTNTRWSSNFTDNEWIYADLGAVHNITQVNLDWEVACGKDYQIQVSNDAVNWTTIQTVTGNTATGWLSYPVSATGRYVRILGTLRATYYGYSLWEYEVYGY